MKRVLIFFVMINVCLLLFSTLRTVSLDGTMQYTQIQSAINASTQGDTVLVYPGRYLENVLFNGRNILLSSLYLFNQADSLIEQTIIDGHQNGTCVRIVNGESYQATLNGFTVENGNGTSLNGIKHGGGIEVKNSYATVKNCIIQYNEVIGNGGGLTLWGYTENQSGLYLSACTVRHNIAYNGGGINVIYGSEIFFDPINLNSFYDNRAGSVNDIMILNTNNFYNIPLATGSVLYQDNNYIYSACPINLTVQTATQQFVNHDLFVSPDGDDDNSGFSFAEPLQTIAKAFEIIASDSLNPKTVYLAPGTYSRSQNNQHFPVNMKKFVNLYGDDPENTIIDCEGFGGIICSYDGDRGYKIKNLTFHDAQFFNQINSAVCIIPITLACSKDITIENCKFTDCWTSSINWNQDIDTYYPENTSLTLKNIKIIGHNLSIGLSGIKDLKISNLIIKNSYNDPDPEADFGYFSMFVGNSSLAGWKMNVKMANILFENNHNYIANWPVLLVSNSLRLHGYADFTISNMTATNNTSTPGGGPISVTDSGVTAHFYNSLIYGNSPNQIWFWDNDFPPDENHLYFNNCLIQGGESAIQFLSHIGNFSHWGSGNIDLDPLFQLQGDFPYALSQNSPCIDAGTLNIPDFTFPETDLAGNPRISGQTIDIGAYEYQQAPIDFIASPLVGEVPLTVQFINRSDNAQSFEWDFNNDGIIDSELQNPVYTYTQPNTYSVRLTINNGAETTVKENYIQANPSGNQDSPNILKNELFPAKPNPFSMKTGIKMTIKDKGKVRVDIYNIKGQRVKTLFNANVTSGIHDMIWEGIDQRGQKVSSGVYSFVMKINGKKISTQKVTVIK